MYKESPVQESPVPTQEIPNTYSTAVARKILSEILARASKWIITTIENHWIPKWVVVHPEIWKFARRVHNLDEIWVNKKVALAWIQTLPQFIDIYPWEKVSLLDLLNHIVDRVAFFISEEPKN